MNKLILTGNEKVLHEGTFFQVVNREFKFGDQTRTYEHVRRAPGTRVIIAKDGKILLIKEYRTELEEYDYHLPGGKVFDRLSDYLFTLRSVHDMLPFAVEAAKKECLEEAGVIVKDMEFFQLAKAGATITWDLFYFIVKDFEKNVGGQQLEEEENIVPVWKSFKEVKGMCLNNEIKEDRTIGVLLRFLLQLEN